MADVNANIRIDVDTSQSLAEIKNLQRQLAQLYTSINRGSAAAAAAQKGLATNLINTVNAGGKFYAQMGTIRTSTESFTHALEKNKLTMREYFRFAGGSTRTFGRLFKSEFDTIGRVAEERVKKMQTQYIKLGRDASGAMRAISITPTSVDMKNYGNQVAVAAQKQALLNQLLRQGSTNVLNFGKNLQWSGRQLMVGFTIPLAYFGTAAAKTFMDLEAQALKFRRVYGDMFTTTEQTNKALADIEALAKQFTKYGVAVSKTMEMAASAAAMGRTGAELTAQVAQATRLAVLGNVEQDQALLTTISLTDAFGLAAEDLAGKINFLNSVENQTITAIEDLTVAIPKAGPVVKQLGGSVEDLAFFLTAMREGGINASEGANALKSGLASLINPTEKAAAMLAGMGINIKAIVEGNVGNLRQTVIDFSRALDTLAPLERSRAIEQLFGKFQFARLSTLFENVTKDGGQAARVLDLAGKSVEELAILSERELGAVEDAIGTNFKEAVEQFKMAIAPIGKEFLKALTPVVKFFGELFEKFGNLSDGSKKFIVVLTTLLGLVGPTLIMTFGLLLNAGANIVKMFLLMRQGFLKLTGNTTNLAQQSQYLNSEQMEAAVVAASLNQAHTRLTQQFTLEAGAVNQLRNAYVQATAAAARFAATNPGMMIPGAGKIPKKFNYGTMKVPGYARGTDSVPAMLTPGEAVIPEPIAQDDRFKPIIAALVSGKIAKYNDGTTEVGKQDPFSQKNLPLIRSDIPSLNPGQKGVMYFDFDGTLANTTKAIEEWKVKNNIPGPTDDSTYRAFNRAIMRGEVKQVDGVRNNLMRLRLAKAKGYDVQVLTAREDTPDNVKALKKTLGSLGVNIEDSKIHLKPAGSGMTDDKFKAGFLSSRSSKDVVTVLVDDKPENLQAAKKIKNVKVLDAENTAVRFGDKVFNAKDVKTKKAVLAWMKENVTVHDDGSITVKGPKATRNYESPQRALRTIQSYLERHPEKGFGSSMIERALSLDRGAGTIRGREDWVKTAMAQAAAVDPFSELLTDKDGKPVLNSKGYAQYVYKERGAIEKALKNAGLQFNEADMKRLLTPHASHFIAEEYLDKDNNKVKVWRPENIGRDAGYINSYLNDRVKTILPEIKQLPDDALKGLGISRKDIDRFERGMHPKTASMAKSLMGIAQYDIDRDGPTIRAVALKSGLGERFALGGYAKNVPSLRKLLPKIKIGGKTLKEIEKQNLTKVAIRAGQEVRKKKTGAIVPTKAFPLTPEEKSNLPVGQRLSHIAGRLMGPKSFIPKVGATAEFGAPPTLAEMGGKTVQQVAAQHRVSLSQAKRMVAENEKAMRAQQQNTVATTALTAQKATMGQRLATGAHVFSGLTIAGSFMGGKIGEVSQKLAPFAMILSTLAMLGPGLKSGFLKLLPLLANPFVAAGIAIAGIAIAAKVLDEKMKKQARAQSDYIDTISATTEKMKAVGEITGKVGASEIMSRRRQGSTADRFTTGFDRAGQQFGTTFLESDAGKNLASTFQKELSKGGEGAVRQIALELSAYVSDGIMTAEQANSVARAIGINMADMSIAANIQGEIRQVIGPDGQDLATNPLLVRLKIVEESRTNLNEFTESLSNQVAGNNFSYDLAAAGAASGIQSLETLQAQRDAQAKLTADKIRDLETEKSKTTDKQKQAKIEQQIAELIEQQASDDKQLAGTRSKIINDQLKLFKQASRVSSRTETAFFESAKQQVKTKFKGDPFVEKFLDESAGLGSKELEVQLLTVVGAGDLTPRAATNFIELFDGDEAQLNAVVNSKVFAQNPDKFAQLVSITGGLKGKGSKKTALEILTKLSAEGQESKLDDRLNALTLLQKMDGREINISAFLSGDADKKLDKLVPMLNEIEKMKSPITQEVVQNLSQNPELKALGKNAFAALAEDWEHYVNLPPETQKTAIETFITVYETIGAKEKEQFAINKAGGATSGSVYDYYMGMSTSQIAAAMTKPQFAAGTKGSNIVGGGNKGGATGGKSDPFEDLNKKLRTFRDFTISASGGLAQLQKLFKDDKAITKFSGSMQDLAAGPQGGINRAFLDYISELDQKTFLSLVNQKKFKKGILELNEKGRAVKDTFNAIDLGMFQQGLDVGAQNTLAQQAAFIKLKNAGLDTYSAMELVSNEELAVAVNAKKSSGSIMELVNSFKNAENATKQFNVELGNLLVGELKDFELLKQMPNLVDQMKKLGLNSDQIKDVLSNPKLAQGLINDLQDGKIDSELIAEYLNSIPSKKIIEIDLQMKTPEGQLEIFEKGFGEAMNFFDAQEALIELERAPGLKEITDEIEKQEKAVADAEAEIEKYQKTINDLQFKLEYDPDFGSRAIDNIREQIEKERKEIEKLNEQIEKFRSEIETRQRFIELNFERPLQQLGEESSDLSNDLTLMDRIADGINKKYDAQAEALQKVSDINQEILNQQKGQLDLADALSSGDIAAAARVAQESRSQAAANAAQRASGVLDAARQTELGGVRSASGMTRSQIEERQFQISQQSFNIEKQRKVIDAEILYYQDQIYKTQQLQIPFQEQIKNLEAQIEAKEASRAILTKQIADEQFKIDQYTRQTLEPAQLLLDKANSAKDAYVEQTAKLFESLTHLGNTKTEWENIKTRIDAATTAGASLQVEMDKNAKLVASIASNWKSIESKTITLTVHTVYTSSGTGPGITTTSPKAKMYGGKILPMAMGGSVPKVRYESVPPQAKGYSLGGSIGSDTVPAMLTPGEFVVNKASSKAFAPFLNAINESKYPSLLANKVSNARPIYQIPIQTSLNQPSYNVSTPTFNSSPTSIANASYSDNSSSVYNYSVGISVGGTSASPETVAKAVMNEIKYLDSQRVNKQRVS